MREEYNSLFALLEDIDARLKHLIELAEKKIEAVHEDDLMKINDILNEEQAETLAFRNLERQRVKILQELGLTGTSLSALPEHCPAELKAEAVQRVTALQKCYQSYQETASKARELLEKSIDEIDTVLTRAGQMPQAGPGYGGESSAPPPNMKTDFRA